MSNIVDLFNKNTIEFTKSIPQRWMIENKNLTNFETRKFSVPVMTSEMKNEYLNIDIEDQLIRVIKSEIEQDISKSLIKILFNTNKFDYLDLRPNGTLMNGRTHLENLVNMILNNDYDNLITTSLVASELQDSQHFFPYATTANLKTSTLPDCSGKLGNRVEVYNDPYMRFNDGRICLFNNVEFNIGEMKATEVPYAGSMAPKILIEYNIAYNVNDSKLIFVIESENSESYLQYKSLQRDIKIDNILDGETSK